LIANEKTPCRKFRWFWTVFEDSPSLRLRLRYCATLCRPDLVDWTLAEERHEVAAQVSAVVLDSGALALHHMLQMIDISVPGLPQRASRGCGHDHVALDPLAQLLLGLGTSEPIRRAGCALDGDLALYACASRPPRSVPTDASCFVGDLEQAPTAV
jgi:hypothetical protein